MFVLKHQDLQDNVNNNLKPKAIPCFKFTFNSGKGHPALKIKKTEVDTDINQMPAPRFQSYLWTVTEEIEEASLPSNFALIEEEYEENTYWVEESNLYIISNNLSGVNISLEYLFSYPSLTKTVSKAFSPNKIIYKGNYLSFSETGSTLTYIDSMDNLQGGEEITWSRDVNISEISYSQFLVHIFDIESNLDIKYIEWGGKFYGEKGKSQNYFLYNELDGVLILV